MRNTRLRSWTLRAVLTSSLVLPATMIFARPTEVSLCEAPWVIEQRENLPPGIVMLYAGGQSFRDGDVEYAAAIAFTDSRVATLVVFEIENEETASPIHELRFEFSYDEISASLEATGGCVAPDKPPVISLRVLDLDADDRAELLLQTNETKMCPACPNRVRVFQLEGATVQMVLDEPYLDLQAEAGEGLVVKNVVAGLGGRSISTRKVFFRGAKN